MLRLIESFYQIASTLSITKAAEIIGSSKATVSKQLASLEDKLQVRLITRNTRHMFLTNAGEHYFEYCKKIMGLVEEAEQGLQSEQETPAGQLTISCPKAFGERFLNQFLIDFQKRHPKVQLRCHHESRVINLYDGQYDLVIRASKLADSGLIAQKLVTFTNKFILSREYENAKQSPKTPEDLKGHRCVFYSENTNTKQFQFHGNHKTTTVMLDSALYADNLSLVKSAVEQGYAVGYLPDFIYKSLLQNMEHKICLPEYALNDTALYVVYLDRKYLPKKIQCFLSELKLFFRNL